MANYLPKIRDINITKKKSCLQAGYSYFFSVICL